MRRVHDADDLRGVLAIVEPHEPRATIVAAALRAAIARRDGVVICVADDGGTVAGVVAWLRRCTGRWSCYPLVLDSAVAPLLARAIDASRAREAFGFATDIDVLAPQLSRARHETRMPGFAVPAPIPVLPDAYDPALAPGMSARLASAADLASLTRCYEGYELIDIPTVGQLRRHLRREMNRGHDVLIVERDGQVVAANRILARSERFAFWSDATVLPAERGQGLMRYLISGCVETSRSLHVGIIGTLTPSNPMPVGHARTAAVDMGGGTDEWVSVWMGWRLRFRGQGRVLKARDRVLGRRRKPRRIEFPAQQEDAG